MHLNFRNIALALGASLLFAPAAAAAQSATQKLVRQKCSTCHTVEVAVSGKRSPTEWSHLLDLMVGHGMKATRKELSQMHGLLRTNRGMAALQRR